MQGAGHSKLTGRRAGSFAAAKRNVLAAAEYAVIQENRQASALSDAIVSPCGLTKAALKRPVRDWSGKFKSKKTLNFIRLTKEKKAENTPFVTGSGKKWEASRAAKLPPSVASSSKVAYVSAAIGAKSPVVIAGGRAREETGKLRFMTADLAVVENLELLCSCSLDDSLLHHVLAIVGRGLPVVTKATWLRAQGDPGKIPEGSVVFHRPLAMITTHTFAYTDHFRARAANVVETLRSLAALPKCKWVVEPLTDDRPLAMINANLIQLTDEDCLRTYINRHRSIANVCGPKAWTVDEAMV